MATTSSPTCTADESPSTAGVTLSAGRLAFSTARSSCGDVPATVALTVVPSCSVISIWVAPAMT